MKSVRRALTFVRHFRVKVARWPAVDTFSMSVETPWGVFDASWCGYGDTDDVDRAIRQWQHQIAKS